MGRLWKHSCALLATLAIASTLWAGKEFPALPGQPVVPNQLLVRYKPGTPTAAVTSSLVPGSQAVSMPTGVQDLYLVQLPPGTDASFSTQLSQHPSVEYVEPNRIRHTTVQTPNDMLLTSQGQWDLTTIQALQTWQLLPNVYLTSTTASAGRIKVAVIDTGADCTHPDFINTGGVSTDAAFGGQLMWSLSQAFVATTVANPTCPWQDDYGHGTHVSGTVAAATNNAAGVASLGYPLQLIEYKVLDHTGSGSDMDVASAITAAADAGASVISMSLGGAGYSQTIQDAINHAWQKNAVVLAAAGNSNTNALFFPVGANNATGVAATDSNDSKASFSNFGPSVDIAAPGVGILSTKTTYSTPLGGSSYGPLDGTSMATPHVAALAGLIDMATPNLASMAVVQRIQQSADGVDGTVASGGWGQNMGYGRINAYRAISVNNLRSASVGGFVGQVVDSTGLPVASATVTVVGQTSVTTDGGASADGLFRIPNLAAGMTYTLTTTAAGFSSVTMKAAVVAGADTTVTIVMGITTGEFHGIVSDAGVPIPGAVVQALSAGLVRAAAVTDSTGAYSLLVPPGTFDLQSSLMYGVTTMVTSNNVGANGSVAVNIPMAKMGSISGTVSDSSFHPVANATITITATGFSAGAVTDVNGAYHTIGIPAGTYSASATAAGSATGATINGLVVTNDQVMPANFTINSVTVTTNPAGLSVTVDNTNYAAPQSFYFAPGSTHTIAVTSPQNSTGVRNTFSNWSDGGAVSHTLNGSFAPTYTATFTSQYLLTLAASPSGGGMLAASPPSNDGYYVSGTSVQVMATANPGYQFTNFSGDLSGTTNPQSVVMNAPRSVTADFNVQTMVTTIPSGLAFTVDGQPFTAPQTFFWAQGSSHPVSVASPQNGAAGTQYAWLNWSDAGAISHNVITPGTPTTYTANFTTRYLLTLAASPGAGGTLSALPTSPDGYYASGTSVQVTSTANTGYQFANFSGDLSGTTNPQSVVMSASRAVTGNFNVAATVTTSPAGLSIIVDGATLVAPQTFSWTPGSSHSINVLSPQNGPAGTHYAWSSWSDGGAISHNVVASPTTYTATFATQYLLTLAASPGAGGSLGANPSSGDGYYASGTSVQVTATNNAGYQFANFSGDLTGSMNPQSLVMSAPRSVTAAFNVQTTVATNPSGLAITVDGQPFTAPQTFSWAQGSSHTIAVLSPQNGTTGMRYAWSNWSDGQAISHAVTASSSATYTANFTSQYLLNLIVSPGGAGSLVATPSSADGYYANGTSVQLTATANSGYQFGSLSGALTGTSNPQSVVMSAPRSVTGNFTALSGAVVSTNPPGLSFTVDGVSYIGTQNFSWALGSVHTLAVNSPQNGSAGSRYAWANWSDGGAISHTITVTNATVLYTANFTTQFLLALSASPNSGGSLTANPASADGYYASGTSVQIIAAAASGFTFTGFSGDLTGSTNPQSIAMTAPRSVTGSFSGFSTLTVDRAKLNFGTANGMVTSPQTVRVNIAAGVSWSASSNRPNIGVSPSSGIGSGTFQVTASAGPGGVVTVSSSGASGSPQIQVNVTTVIPAAPFGSFDTPANNVTGVAGAVAVTGWALDSVEVTKVDIWREPITGEATGSNGLVYIGDAVFVADARPDVEGLNPSAPLNYRAGWGYLLLTNFLPNNNGGTGGPGNGPYNLHAIAHNKSGTLLDLGTRTITADNAHATKPFGTIDTPGQGGTASGSAYINFGWVLTQNPNVIPFDGSTITVYVDSVPVGHPTYNQFRSDIASLFPGHANSNGAVGFFYIDTTKLANGVHTISWTVFDNVGHGDGVGSRFFNVQNNGGGPSAEPEHSLDTEAAEQVPVEIDQLGRVELQVGAVSGRLLVAGEQRPLPIGSTLKDGVFYWQPSAGFLGEYQLVFERADGSATKVRIKVGTVYSTTNSRSRKRD